MSKAGTLNNHYMTPARFIGATTLHKLTAYNTPTMIRKTCAPEKHNFKASKQKDGTPAVKKEIAVAPGMKRPPQGWILKDAVTNPCQEPCLAKRGHQGAEGHSGTRRVPSSRPSRIWRNTRGTRYGGAKSQL